MTVQHAWAGAATATGFRVKAKISGGNARLAVSTSPTISSPVFFPGTAQAPTSDGIVDLTATGLANDTQYYWAVEVAGTVDLGVTGAAHTHEPVGSQYSFRFAYSACAGSHPVYPASTGLAPDRVSNHPVFESIRDEDPSPLFFIHGGDFAYYDFGSGVHVPNPVTAATYRDMYNTVLGTARQGGLYRNVPTVYMWDDHCYGPNDSDGTNPNKGLAAQVYRERVPSYPLVEGSGSIYHAFQVGRVQFVAMDIRFNRSVPTDPDGPSHTMLGPSQLAWLDTLLGSTTSEMLCLIQGQRWNVVTAGTSNWGSFPTERQTIVDMLGDHGWRDPGRMFMVSGDVHATGMNTGATNNYGGFPLFHGASLDSSISPPPIPGMDLGWRSERGQYLTVDVTDTGQRIKVNVAGRYV